MRYIVFPKQGDAKTASSQIHTRAGEIYLAQGYALVQGPEGMEVVGKRASDGTDQHEAAHTIVWDRERMRLNDGRWVISHPENHPDGALPYEGMTVSEYMIQDLIFPVIEEEDPSWWIPPEPEVTSTAKLKKPFLKSPKLRNRFR